MPLVSRELKLGLTYQALMFPARAAKESSTSKEPARRRRMASIPTPSFGGLTASKSVDGLGGIFKGGERKTK
jgi:hypothetical protein